jgi:predicted P-loop ATPase
LTERVMTTDPRLITNGKDEQSLADPMELVIRTMVIQHSNMDKLELKKVDLHDAILAIAHQNEIHPFRDWLDSLRGTWDGKPRLSYLFHDYFLAKKGEPIHDEYVRALSRIFLIAAVKRCYDPGCQFDHFIILISDQGIGKSQGIRALVGPKFYSDESLFRYDRGRDRMEQMEGFIVIEFADLASYTRRDTDDLKSFLTRMVDHGRMVYDKNRSDRSRQCIFIGTTNESNFLKDWTGNRRFNPIQCEAGSIDIFKIELDRTQLWAEAVAAYDAGEDIMLPPDLIAHAMLVQKAAMEHDLYIDLLDGFEDRIYTDKGAPIPIVDRHLHSPGKTELRVSTRDIVTHVLEIPSGSVPPGLSRRIKVCMHELGWKYNSKTMRIFDRSTRGYTKIVDDPTTTATPTPPDDEDTPF